MSGQVTKKVASSPALNLQTLDHLQSEDLVLWVASDERPLRAAAGYVDWRCNGWLSRLIANGQFRCDRGEKLLTLSQGRIVAKRVFLIGLGETKSFHSRGAEELGLEAAKMLEAAAAKDVAIGLPGVGDQDTHSELFKTLQKHAGNTKLTAWGPWRRG